ncbi:MAG: glycine/D-amino acid oxidase-like deaminating enzyme [Paracoccaceae bacterium]|jgi:glycine/D-amino acid oxidase-like deaminating enzyme
MKRIYSQYAYGPGPRDTCWWDETIAAPDWPTVQGDLAVDVAIVGGGFTGMSAALHLAESGASVAVLEAETPGWGASGRNGGFCCLGGAKLSSSAMVSAFGSVATDEFSQAEVDAISLVSDLLDRFGIDVDRHSDGETQLAHRPKDMDRFLVTAAQDPTQTLIEAADLAAHGMNGPFFGALTTPVGFGLNPRKYLFGLAAAANAAGAQLFQQSAVTSVRKDGPGYLATTTSGQIRCKQVLIATNGYSSDGLPDWISGRYIPTQSTVLVTRPMSIDELAAQGWTSNQMSYDTRNLLHYFRLMPDRRFLFGMRGGLISSPTAERQSRQRTRRDFERIFPAWRDIQSGNSWSGMVCLSRKQVPYAGPVPGQPGMFAGFAYHGNGVAMGSYTGRLLAGLAGAKIPNVSIPEVMKSSPGRFPLGRARRALLPPFYAAMGVADL